MELKDITRMLAEREADVEALRRVARMMSEPQGDVVPPIRSTPASGFDKSPHTISEISEPAKKETVGALVRRAIDMLPSGDFCVPDVRANLAKFLTPERLAQIKGPQLSTETSRLAKKGVIQLKEKGYGSPSTYHKP